MPGNENRTTVERGPAEKTSAVCTARCTTEDKPRRVDNQVAVAQRNELGVRRAGKHAEGDYRSNQCVCL